MDKELFIEFSNLLIDMYAMARDERESINVNKRVMLDFLKEHATDIEEKDYRSLLSVKKNINKAIRYLKLAENDAMEAMVGWSTPKLKK